MRAVGALGNADEAIHQGGRALELCPDCEMFWSNMGWYHLCKGSLPEARQALQRALALDPDLECAGYNLEVHDYLCRHGGSFLDYLLRPTDVDEIHRLEQEEDFEGLQELRGSYDASRLEAWAQCAVQEDERQISRIGDRVSTLRSFFGFVDSISQESPLNADVRYLEDLFKPIMHKFIFKFRDVDRAMIEELYECLFDYLGFLSRRRLVDADGLKSFRKHAVSLKTELIDVMIRYDAIRHSDELDDDEKETIRDELFEGDHAWPFL